ncbi:arsenical resistance protein [Trabulsiella guamensis ATCC 49490]|uniref:Arsenical resistance protein n=1 Tax=Trabulsiella guamensis ATCC 49490 TaxID=1005994 RepID=A0A085AE47_9ENTR|nr:arsenic resistance protein [Trabulsiella guamensis]KFC08492.1 arsenical resistance protein [Trabulsiella guamensis ATCC 49490]
MGKLRDTLEQRQVFIYFTAVAVAVLVALLVPGTERLMWLVNPALAFMLFVTFLQVPIIELGKAITQLRFLAALLLTNFIAIPLLVTALLILLPDEPFLHLGVLLVLLCPCIDYVVTFSQLGRADARLLLAATPALLIVQILLLPLYLNVFLGERAAEYAQPEPFLHAFLWLIAVPLAAAVLVQWWAKGNEHGSRVSDTFGLLPVPATALVLFVVVVSVVPQMGSSVNAALHVVPVYLLYAIIAPLLGWSITRLFRLETAAGRAVAFSAGTRNSLVILPLALAVPGAIPVLPAVIVTQTLVELVTELIYIRVMPRLGRE